MKLISLNIWGGRLFEPIMEFFKKYSREIDIFCLQEVVNNPAKIKSVMQHLTQQGTSRDDIYKDISATLSKFEGYIAPRQDNEGLAMFIKKNLSIKTINDIFVYRWKNAMINNDGSTYGVNLQYAKIEKGGHNYLISNLHGHWEPGYKDDSPPRLEQSQNTKKFLNSVSGPKILCGDFNLASDTQSIKILEDSGMRNLIKEYGITSTRSHFYTKKVKFADYILVSPEVTVKNFEVLQDVVSDHLPLFLEFN